jgi:isopenicillin N synthase-like dioxygenase
MPPIQWPKRPDHLQKAYLEYYQALEQLAAKLLQLFALALKLPEHYFDDKITRHRSALRVLNYPELQQMPPPGMLISVYLFLSRMGAPQNIYTYIYIYIYIGQIRAGEHTDYGSLTILLQDKVGGLQVRDKKGNWVDVAPVGMFRVPVVIMCYVFGVINVIANSFVINIGDLMQRWTNDQFVSTLHRVIAPQSMARRQSLAFFHNIDRMSLYAYRWRFLHPLY